ncbi:sigma 54-interacting transcriptional regulator [Lachnospiraceae bacterium 62-35]
MKRKDRVYEFLRRMKAQEESKHEYTAAEIAMAIGSSRANVSGDLNRLLEERLVEKAPGRPVRYSACAATIISMPIYSEIDASCNVKKSQQIFRAFIGYDGSLRTEVEKAKAGILYPPYGLPMLIVGETGVGKSMFARLLFEYAKEMGRLSPGAIFVAFNCADYASNPQLLLSQLFGHMKGAYTGADKERNGLVEKADGGILFLDEVHRLPPEAQEMLFTVMDYGKFRRLGEAEQERISRPRIILATTDIQNTSLLDTFKRRIPINITIPALSERNVYERLKLVEEICKEESSAIMLPIRVDAMVMKALTAYNCPGNIGQLKNDIKVICAKAYVQTLLSQGKELHITVKDIPPHIKLGFGNIDRVYSEINLIVSNFVYWPGNGERINKESNEIYEYISHQLDMAIQGETYTDIKEGIMTAIKLFCFGMNKRDESNRFHTQMLLTAEVIHLVNYSARLIRQKLSIEMTAEEQKALAVLQGTILRRLDRKHSIVCPFLSWIKEQALEEFKIARDIIEVMNPECEEENKENSAGFLAGFLLQLVREQAPAENFCEVFVISKGQGAAQAIAKVANEILDQEFVGWYDIVCDRILPQEEERITDAVKKHFGERGGIILYEPGALDETIKHVKADLVGTGIYMLGNIRTSLVIEAGVAACELHNTPSRIFERLQYLSEEKRNDATHLEEGGKASISRGRSRAIVTACVSGCGVAIKMKQLIEKKYILPQDINILAMDISSGDEFKNKILNTQKEYEILCIIGLDIGMDLGIPYIPANEFIIGNGEEYFLNLMESYCLPIRRKDELVPGKSEYEKVLIKKNYFSSFLHYLNSETLIPYVEDGLNEMETVWGTLEPGKRIVLLVHICCMVERLMFGEPGEDQESSERPKAEQKNVLEAALSKLSEVYRLNIPDYEYQMIEQIINIDFNG